MARLAGAIYTQSHPTAPIVIPRSRTNTTKPEQPIAITSPSCPDITFTRHTQQGLDCSLPADIISGKQNRIKLGRGGGGDVVVRQHLTVSTSRLSKHHNIFIKCTPLYEPIRFNKNVYNTNARH